MTIDLMRGDPASPTAGAGTGRALWARVRVLAGGGILGVVIWRLGTGPFLEGLRTIDARALAAAAVLSGLTTVCSAWRWCLVARGQGVALPLRAALAAYYRSQLLNTVLPGGVLGDVHRGVSHGRDVDDVGRGLRSVAWERLAGQAVQLALTLLVLLALPSPVRSSMPVVLVAVGAAALGAVLVGRALPRPGPSRWGRVVRAAGADVRVGLLPRQVWPGVVVASIVVVAGHTLTFVIAARTAGLTASPAQIVPLALLVLLASAAPTNVGGWGPREGFAAWAFGVAGLGAGQGVATTVVYGVMVLVGTLPGAGVMIASWLRRDPPSRVLATGAPEGVVRG